MADIAQGSFRVTITWRTDGAQVEHTFVEKNFAVTLEEVYAAFTKQRRSDKGSYPRRVVIEFEENAGGN